MAYNNTAIRLPWSITVPGEDAWRTRVIQQGIHAETWFTEVKTALLYGDRVSWLAIAQDGSRAASTFPSGTEKMIRYRQDEASSGESRYREFRGAAEEFGLPLTMERLIHYPTMKVNPKTASICLDYEPFAKRMKSVIEGAQVLITDRKDDAVVARWWDAPSAAQILMQELSHLLLPEVGEMPLPEIAEMRSRLEPQLDGLRAEMLGLSETLRKLVKSDSDPTALRHEARNVIATNVEPVVRETAILTQELMEKRWKKLLIGAAKVIGFAGAGFFQAGFWKDALKEAAKTVSAVADVEAREVSMKHSAQFVLEARTYLARE